MSRQTIIRIITCFMVTAIAVVALIALVTSGKMKVSHTAEVKVQGGAVVEGGSQTIYLPVTAGEVSFAISADGPEGILTSIGAYTDSAASGVYFTLTATKEVQEKDKVMLSGPVVCAVVEHTIETGKTLQDGTYSVTTTIKMTDAGTFSGKLLLFLSAAVVLCLFLWLIRFESGRTAEATKKELRMRGRAYSGAFFTLCLMVLAFSLMSGMVDKFPFTVYQAGMISVLVAATVFLVLANRMNALKGLREKRTVLFAVFLIVAVVNLIAGMISILSKQAAIDPAGTGMIRNGVVNFAAAACLFVMVIELALHKGESQRSGRSGRRTGSGYVPRSRYDAEADSGSDSRSDRRSERRVRDEYEEVDE